MKAARVLLVALALAGAACRHADEPPRFHEPLKLGGQVVSVEALEHGRAVYTGYCRPCHGAQGDGKGPAAPGLQPPPRDLRLGVYKFGAVPAGQLPTDADFVRIIRGGLHGTAMQAWDVPVAELGDLIQYVKSFSPRWQKETAGEPVEATPDPWSGREAEGVERGKRVYHGLAQCAVACHPAYVTKAEIYAFTKELTSMNVTDFRVDNYDPVAKDSDYGVKILPPDFTFSPLRAGDAVGDIYRTVASGIGGTAMPTWKGVLPDADLWAMAHYVRSLVELKGTPEAAKLRAHLVAMSWWTPPKPAASDGGVAADAGR
jgi:mono/diheme cytochrome c family protein